MELSCPRCYESISIDNCWDQLGEEVTCEKCSSDLILCFDESWDNESEEEFQSWWLELK